MRTKYFLILAFSSASAINNSSCKKELSCEGCNSLNNKPPIARAGHDRLIFIPQDSIVLDGSASSDPDGSIVKYSWTRISGPSFSSIVNGNSGTTAVLRLVRGFYEFELTVTDNGGLFSKDTLRCGVIDSLTSSNQPPVAIAGYDQVIAAPAGSSILDGSSSYDPDNNIMSYQWTQISSNAISVIQSPGSVTTPVQNLLPGIYVFQLRVTDSLGLFSMDTVSITVQNFPAYMGCDTTTRPVISAQVSVFGSLSKPKIAAAVASAANKIVIAGGQSNELSGNWSEHWGTTRVDIYDLTTQTWSTAELSEPRFGIAAVSAGNKIFFAGGESGDGAFNLVYANVDVYDAVANTWSVLTLSQARSYIGAAVVGNKVFFAGGEINDHQTSDRVDIYDISTGTWSTAQLTSARANVSATTINNKIFFSGGWHTNYWSYSPSDRIDIYDNANGSWSTSLLSQPMGMITGVTTQGSIFWSEGCNVEKRDPLNGQSTFQYLHNPNTWYTNVGQTAVVTDDKIVFFRCSSFDNLTFDIYDTGTNTWSIGELAGLSVWDVSIIAVDNMIYLVGGRAKTNSTPPYWSSQVFKLHF